jgi:hypothetical protein
VALTTARRALERLFSRQALAIEAAPTASYSFLMASPRIFISSTYYDLRQIREDIERTIRELGYEPIRHETGAIPYSKDDKLEASAYREVEHCDVIVAIIGGRYGTSSHENPGFSISQTELKRALERGVQVFIFIEKNVHGEFATYEVNKETKGIKYRHVDNPKIFEFIEELNKLPRNNAMCPFETAHDISTFLRVQFAGLFQRFLQEERLGVELKVLADINSSAQTLREVVNFLTEERKNSDQAIKSILLVNHPAFARFAKLTNTKYRVFFTNLEELNTWMKACEWTPVDARSFDPDSVLEWTLDTGDRAYIKVTKELFDERGTLVNFGADWSDEWITLNTIDQGSDGSEPPPDSD